MRLRLRSHRAFSASVVSTASSNNSSWVYRRRGLFLEDLDEDVNVDVDVDLLCVV